ncbi:sulfite exporter TauE/SafE family protein [Pseudomaricurvus alkylphenolicus]|uniref:sulfite exporter TauE/SafE family protein n=1 Tax=Pseudomaricurvus alkylphenolicus TaxID=1306991 RepID=UPI00141EB91C|nr:sulfite exporter TauE/SafE family protein [Pseudomaricurvus alkylphenolicus]NIB40336.1 sulfite exporter TauE/SafE family protein [Pseudomaricurvus alkylphenolicus]
MSEFELLLLAFFSLVAAVVSTLAGMGGGVVLLACTTLILPISVVVPLNGVFMLGGQLSRLWHFRAHLDWPITRAFMIGSLVGALVGAQAFSFLSEQTLTLVLGCMLLVVVWCPPIKVSISLPQPFIWVGAVHTWLSTITGLGGLMQGIMLRSQLTRHAVIATIAGSLLMMSVFKTIGFIWVGFDYSPYFLAIAVAIAFGFAGTWLGKLWLTLVSEAHFRQLMQWLLTAFALRLLWLSWVSFSS